jgi:hypothetical protein
VAYFINIDGIIKHHRFCKTDALLALKILLCKKLLVGLGFGSVVILNLYMFEDRYSGIWFDVMDIKNLVGWGVAYIFEVGRKPPYSHTK